MKALHQMIEYLGIRLPVEVSVRTRRRADCDAFYIGVYSDKTGLLKSHKIVVYTVDAHRDFDTLLAHELIHAWQEEHKKAEIHGRHFQRLAQAMGEHFGLQNIYMPDVDEN